MLLITIQVVLIRNTYLERAVGKNEKLEGFKLERMKFKSLGRSWKVRVGVGKYNWSWKVPEEV